MFCRRRHGLWFLLSGVTLWACGNNHLGNPADFELGQPADSDFPFSGNSTKDSNDIFEDDTHLGWSSDSTLSSDSGNVCVELNIEVEMVPARLMILQDLTGSMSENEYGQDSPPSKWDQARTALRSMLGNKKLNLDWGFDTFPGLGDCSVRWSVLSDTKPNNARAIMSTLNILFPGGSTALYLAMKNFTKRSYAPKFLSPDATSYLLVVSDGADNCGVSGIYNDNNGATPAQLGTLTRSLLSEFGIKTFVIGFGNGAEKAQLNAIAAAGGTGRDTFFDAKNGSQLQTALMNIASSVVSCVYDINQIDETDVDPDSVNFYFDNEVVKMDDGCAKNTGWSWLGDKKNRIQFCKAACDELQSGNVNTISAKYGCKQEIIL